MTFAPGVQVLRQPELWLILEAGGRTMIVGDGVQISLTVPDRKGQNDLGERQELITKKGVTYG